jgi:hypothetical protein
MMRRIDVLLRIAFVAICLLGGAVQAQQSRAARQHQMIEQ